MLPSPHVRAASRELSGAVTGCRDHAGGNEELVKLVPNICVVGGKADCVAACTWPVAHGDVLKVGQLNVRCLETP